MKIRNLTIVGISALAIAMSACPSATNTTTNTNTNANSGNKNAAVVNSTPANTTATTTTSPAAATDGQVLKLDDAGIVMTVPKGFKYSKDGDDTVVKTEDEGVDIRFTVPTDGDYAKVVTDAAAEVDDYLKDVKVVDKGSEITVNGMKATTMGGTATNEGEPVNWELTIIEAPKKPVLVNIYAAESSLKTNAAAVDAFLKSIKKQ